MARSVDASLVYDEAVMGYRAGQLDGDDASVGLEGLHLQGARERMRVYGYIFTTSCGHT